MTPLRHQLINGRLFVKKYWLLSWSNPKRYDVKEWVMCVFYWVNQKFKDHNLIDTSPCTYPFITIFIKISKINSVVLFFHVVFKISNSNKWTAKHLTQASFTELTWCISANGCILWQAWIWFYSGPTLPHWPKQRQICEKELLLLLVLLIYSKTHFLYRFLDLKKTTRSQFNVPGLREIHRNLKQEQKFNFRESFLWKSPFCTFS